MARVRRHGVYAGAPPLGYRWNRDARHLEVVVAEAPIVERVFELYLSGRGYEATADSICLDGWRSRTGAIITPNAVKYMLGLSVGSLTVPMLGGVRDAAGGFYWLFVILAVCAAVETVAAFALPGGKAAPVIRTPALP